MDLGWQLQTMILANQFVTLDTVFDRGEKFFAEPWLQDEPENLALIDGIHDGVET